MGWSGPKDRQGCGRGGDPGEAKYGTMGPLLLRQVQERRPRRIRVYY